MQTFHPRETWVKIQPTKAILKTWKSFYSSQDQWPTISSTVLQGSRSSRWWMECFVVPVYERKQFLLCFMMKQALLKVENNKTSVNLVAPLCWALDELQLFSDLLDSLSRQAIGFSCLFQTPTIQAFCLLDFKPKCVKTAALAPPTKAKMTHILFLQVFTYIKHLSASATLSPSSSTAPPTGLAHALQHFPGKVVPFF